MALAPVKAKPVYENRNSYESPDNKLLLKNIVDKAVVVGLTVAELRFSKAPTPFALPKRVMVALLTLKSVLGTGRVWALNAKDCKINSVPGGTDVFEIENTLPLVKSVGSTAGSLLIEEVNQVEPSNAPLLPDVASADPKFWKSVAVRSNPLATEPEALLLKSQVAKSAAFAAPVDIAKASNKPKILTIFHP